MVDRVESRRPTRFRPFLATLAGVLLVASSCRFSTDATLGDGGDEPTPTGSGTGPTPAPSPHTDRTFQPPAEGTGEEFGRSVAFVGGHVLIGAPARAEGATEAGIAYLFDGYDGSPIWTLHNPDPDPVDRFGWSVGSLNGNPVVSAPNDDPSGVTDCGSVYLFSAETGDLLRTSPCPAAQSGINFGESGLVEFDGDLLVGAPDRTVGSTNQAGTVYRLDGQTGDLVRTYTNPSPDNEELGSVLAAVDGTLVTAALSYDVSINDNIGILHQFDLETGTLLRSIANPDPDESDTFGRSIAAGNGMVLAGSDGDDTSGSNSGRAYLLSAANGTLLREIANPAPSTGDRFGGAAAWIGPWVAVAATQESDGEGAVYLIDPATGGLLRTITLPLAADGDAFGSAVAAIDCCLLIGAPGAALNDGAVRLVVVDSGGAFARGSPGP